MTAGAVPAFDPLDAAQGGDTRRFLVGDGDAWRREMQRAGMAMGFDQGAAASFHPFIADADPVLEPPSFAGDGNRPLRRNVDGMHVAAPQLDVPWNLPSPEADDRAMTSPAALPSGEKAMQVPAGPRRLSLQSAGATAYDGAMLDASLRPTARHSEDDSVAQASPSPLVAAALAPVGLSALHALLEQSLPAHATVSVAFAGVAVHAPLAAGSTSQARGQTWPLDLPPQQAVARDVPQPGTLPRQSVAMQQAVPTQQPVAAQQSFAVQQPVTAQQSLPLQHLVTTPQPGAMKTASGGRPSASIRTETADARVATAPPAQRPDDLRVHAEWSAEGVRVWLGMNASVLPQLAAIAEQIRRWMGLHNLHVLEISCNGRALEDNPASGASALAESSLSRFHKDPTWPSTP